MNINRNIIPSLHQLNWHALQYALYWAVQTENMMRRGKRNIKVTSYPACAACFQSDICGNIGYGYTGQYKLIPNSFRTPLRRMLQSLGSIGSTGILSKNIIGKCAEVSAVNSFLYECEKCCRNSMIFYPDECGSNYIESRIASGNFMMSEAFRPRTLEHIDRCANCVQLFGSN